MRSSFFCLSGHNSEFPGSGQAGTCSRWNGEGKEKENYIHFRKEIPMWHSIPAIVPCVWPDGEGFRRPPGLSGWLWMLLGEKGPAAAALHSEPGSHVGLQATGLQEGGREERGESWLG